MKTTDVIKRLYKSISQRWRPEDVLALIGEGGVSKRQVGFGSSMGTHFERAYGLEKQLKIAAELFPKIPIPKAVDRVNQLSRFTAAILAAVFLKTDFKNRPARKSRAKITMKWKGHRAYNKRARFVLRFKEKLERYRRQLELTELAQVAKSRLASRISYKDFSHDANTAVYIAYVTARLNRRSTFTWGKQEKSFDQVAEKLFKQLDNKKANWYAIAMVDPTHEIMARLSKRKLGMLVGEWFKVMEASARILKNLASTNEYNLETMIVKKGNDSSTWNEAAGAFNKSRDGWITAMIAAGMAKSFDRFLPGKSLRLMAADVAYMHRAYGSGDLDPDTKVWNVLPKPWDVMTGKQICTESVIKKACKENSVDPLRGWLGWEEGERFVEITKPTPELVHGVIVSSPGIAKILRRAGYFSGKKAQFANININRDYSGDTLKVDIAS